MKVKFLPQNVEAEVGPNKSVLQVATENHLEIRSICKGVPSCAECRVRIVEGEQNVLPPSKAELNLIGTSYYIDSRRLSCQLRCFGDVTIDLTEQVEKAANQVKKIRGFRASKHVQSHAVNDTMLLNEKIDVNESPRSERPERSEERPAQEKPQGGGGGQQKQQNQQRNQNQNRQQGQQQAKGGGGGGQNQQRQQQQQKPKQQGQGGQQGQQQGKQQNRPQQQGKQQQPQQPRPQNQNQGPRPPQQQNQQKPQQPGPPKPKDS